MRRRLPSIGLALIAACAMAFAVPGQAQALPTNCMVHPHPGGLENGRLALCTGGTGSYRLELTCSTGYQDGDHRFTEYGPWRQPGDGSGGSAAGCGPYGFFRGANIETGF